MKIGLITTTIQQPKVLALYAKHAMTLDDFKIFVAGDLKTPGLVDSDVCGTYIPPGQHNRWKCSNLLPWNSITRRNIALLHALEWGAEVVVTVDDDNIPLNPDYFDHIQYVMERPFNGLRAASSTGWFDVGQMVFPTAMHRGFPAEKLGVHALNSCVGADIGVCAGVVLGDPDIAAVTRIADHPIVHVVSEVLRAGVVVDPSAWTVFNTQNTAVLRRFAPALLCCPQFGRFDDIFASLVCQRMMREAGYSVHFGQPFVWQERNPHDLKVDLEHEVFGMKHVVHLAGVLDHIQTFPVDKHPMRTMYEVVSHTDWCPDGVLELVEAWMEDIKTAMQLSEVMLAPLGHRLAFPDGRAEEGFEVKIK